MLGKQKKGRTDSGGGGSGSGGGSSVTQGNQKVCVGEKKETWENKLLERGIEERAEEGKTAGGKKIRGENPLIGT